MIGKIKGCKYPDEYVMASGHLDAFDVATGGVDCGSGVTPVMEAARMIMKSGAKPKRTMLFCAFAGEEFGLLGSTAWVKANKDKLAFFCHFGLGCVLLSHLLHISPMILWHHFVAAPSSVTSLITEERREGIALFRMRNYGDVSHLYAKGEEPAFAARFCETFDDPIQRHD